MLLHKPTQVRHEHSIRNLRQGRCHSSLNYHMHFRCFLRVHHHFHILPIQQTTVFSVLEVIFTSRQVDYHRTCSLMASSSNAEIPSSCTTPAVHQHDLPTPGQQQPGQVFLSIFVDIRDIVLTRGNPALTSLYGLERVPVFTFRSRDTLQQFRVDDVKQKISVLIWEQLQLAIRTSDFVILFNPSLATHHRWSPGLLKLSYNLTWYEVLHQIDLPVNTPTMMLETCTTSQWQWIQDHHLSSTPRLLHPGSVPGLYA